MDTNNDGVVTRKEFAAAAAAGTVVPTGMVSQGGITAASGGELFPMSGESIAGLVAANHSQMVDVFGEFDDFSDGTVSEEHFILELQYLGIDPAHYKVLPVTGACRDGRGRVLYGEWMREIMQLGSLGGRQQQAAEAHQHGEAGNSQDSNWTTGGRGGNEALPDEQQLAQVLSAVGLGPAPGAESINPHHPSEPLVNQWEAQWTAGPGHTGEGNAILDALVEAHDDGGHALSSEAEVAELRGTLERLERRNRVREVSTMP